MIQFTSLAVDGWWPRLRWPWVLCGSSRATLVDGCTGAVVRVHDAGVWPAGWLSDTHYIVTREVAKDVRQAATVGISEQGVLRWGPSFRAGGPVVVHGNSLWCGGHAAYTPDVAGLWRGTLDGAAWTPILTDVSVYTAPGALRVNAGRLAAHVLRADGVDEWRVLDSVADTVAVLPTEPHCIPGPAGYHGQGYWGPALLRSAAGGRVDVTVAPWQRETCPLPVRVGDDVWCATGTNNDAGFAAVILRPLTDPQRVLQVDGFDAIALDVQVVGTTAVVAGCSERGALSVATLDVTRPRADFVAPAGAVASTFPPGPGWVLRTDVASVDLVDAFLGPVAPSWARVGLPAGATDAADYTHQMQGRWATSLACQHTKVLGPRIQSATWTATADHIGLAYDGTNEMDGYRLVLPGTTTTAALYPTTMAVGPQHRRDVPVDVLTPSNGHRRPVTWRGWVEAVYDGPALGSVPAGTYALVGWTFDIPGDGVDGDPNGVSELTLCHTTHGPVAWRETHRRTGAVRTWYGVTNTVRVADPAAQHVYDLPAVAEDIDEPEPMPTIPEPIITDPEAADAGGRIEHHYAKYAERVGYGARTVHTNPLSYVWGIRYYQERQRGIGHEPAIQAVERAMAQAAGVGEPDPPTEPSEPDEPTEPTPAPTAVRPVVVDGRIMRDTSGAALDWREASAFMLLALWLGQNSGSPALVRERLRGWRARGINTLRVFASIGHPTFWQARGWLLTPRTAGLYRGMHDLTVAAAEEGIRLRWTLLADTADVFRDTADVREHIVRCMDALRGLPVVIEVCNEPTMNGYGSDWAQVLADLARNLDDAAVIALGPEHGATGHLATADRAPADVVFFHAERVVSEGGLAWVRRLGEYGVVKDGTRPVISGEPVNAGDEGAPGDYLRDPAIWFAYGAVSRVVLSHGYAPTFHFDDGLWAQLPNAATQRCLDAFHAGCDAVPLDVRSWAWTNGHHAEAPWRGYDQTDPPSDNRPSRIYGRRSGGTYWGVSLREPKGWSWLDLRYPVERVARAEGERFDCSVWRGRP